MKRTCCVIFLWVTALPLGGCVVGIASSAAGMVVRSAQGKAENNSHLQGSAQQQCTVQASRYGQVKIIDVEQHSPTKIIIWGTIDNGQKRQSFECRFMTRIVGFKLRAMPAPR